MTKRLWTSAAMLMGTVLGAGVLGIPYVVAKSGFVAGLIQIILLGLSLLIVNLYLGEIVLRTKSQHQLTGYMEKYLGKLGKHFMAFSMTFGIYGALTAYLIGQGEAIKAVLGTNPVLNTFVFFIIVASIIYLGIKAASIWELIISGLMIVVIILIGILSFGKINLTNLTLINIPNMFAPYGAIFFAYIGTAAIPEIKEYLGDNAKEMKKSLIIGSLIPIIVYAAFALIIVGIIGLQGFETLPGNQKIATIALQVFANPILVLLANLFAIAAMTTSFITMGLALQQMYTYDYGMKKNIAWPLVMFLPLILALKGISTFITVLSITGAIAGGIDGILIILAYWKAKKNGDRKPEYSLKGNKTLSIVIIILFSIGIIVEVSRQIGITLS